MDFASNYAANTAAKLTGQGIISYTKSYTTNGRMKKGWEEASIAIGTLEKRQKYLAGPDLKTFAEDLTLLDDRGRELLEKSQQAKWPWTHFDEAKKFAKLAVQLKDNVIRTSQAAILKRLASDEVEDDEYTNYMRSAVREMIRLLQERGAVAAGQSVHNDESAIDNNPFIDPTTPTNDNFPPSTHKFDDQTTPTDSVFPNSATSVMTADSALFPDSSSSIMTADSSRPLISPTVPSPAFQSDQGRGLFGSFARRNTTVINGYLIRNGPLIQAPSPALPAADIC